MKWNIQQFKVGETVTGLVQECLPEGDLIISFQGDLLRVQNETRKLIGEGEKVTLIVRATHPLRFQLLEDQAAQRRAGRLDTLI